MDKSFAQKIYQFGDFRLDVGHLLLSRNGEDVALPPKAVATLLVLVEHRGKIVSKDQLLKAVWRDVVVEESNLYGYLHLLRSSLGDRENGKPFVETLHRRGYRFSGDVRVLPQDAEGAGLAPVVDSPNQKNTLPRKIAILPFRSLAAGTTDDLLELGMADTLITRLGNNRSIIVRPLSSVRVFDKPHLDPIKAGKTLRVDAVLEGSIQRSADCVLVNARLIRVADGAILWADTFDRDFTNIFAVQTAIAAKITNALSVNLTGNERAGLEKRHTSNAEAYESYNLGRLHYYRITEENLRKSIAFYEQAVEADPNYALAYAGMANSYWTLAMSGVARAKDVCPKARTFANKALELDASLAEAHMARGWVAAIYEWDWASSEAHFKRALELSPYNDDGHTGYAHFLMYAGRLEEAIREIKRARELGPMSLITFAMESQILTHAGRADQAEQQAKKALDFEPRFWVARNMLGKAYIRQERYREAIEELTAATELAPRAQDHRTLAGSAYAMMGDHEKAREFLSDMESLSKKQFISFYSFATIYNGLEAIS